MKYIPSITEVECAICDGEVNSWDKRCSRALGYKHIVCERCIAAEYWRYENSLQKVLDGNEAEEAAKWHTFSAQRHGRVCKNQAFYNRSEKKWHLGYDPMQCAQYG